MLHDRQNHFYPLGQYAQEEDSNIDDAITFVFCLQNFFVFYHLAQAAHIVDCDTDCYICKSTGKLGKEHHLDEAVVVKRIRKVYRASEHPENHENENGVKS